ncbi:electron transfer flavoprotein subunit alpha/FixB family protein [Achromobacter sp. LC458]|nr:electron transfer flavoprotein subunit alpha/FixB family protein [Achromobacter sp. LC458]
MNPIRRIDPRRQYTVAPSGIRRLVLGADPSGDAIGRQARTVHKPVRATEALRCVLAVAHSDRGQLDAHACQAVAAAALLAAHDTWVHLLVFGEFQGDAADLGADRLTVIAAPPAYAPDAELAVVLALMERDRPLHVFLPDNGLPDGDLGRRLAAATRDTVATHVVELSRDGVASPYRQVAVGRGAFGRAASTPAASAHAGLSRSPSVPNPPTLPTPQHTGPRRTRRALPRIVLLAPDAVDDRLPFVGHGEAARVMPLPMTSAYRDHGTRTLPATEVDLEEADLIVSAGNGMRDLEGFHALADELGAAIGASRVAVDDGRFARGQQIGATGKTVSASAYLAFGISGAVQHLQGIKDCRHVIAINLDAAAPLVRRADLSIIDDTQRVARALLARVKQARGAHRHREAPDG